MLWILCYLGVCFVFLPIITTLLEANTKDSTSRAPYPKKAMKIIFSIGIIILIIVFFLTIL